MRRVIFNNKGGVGKTSIACNLAACLAEQGARVLVLDLDAQANTTSYLSKGSAQFDETMSDFFESTLSVKLFKPKLSHVIHKTAHKGIWLAPADRTLIDLQGKLESRFKITKLRQALIDAEEEFKFDQILIDTPPAINFFSMSGLIAAESVLVPFDCDTFSRDGLQNVVDLIEEISCDHETGLTLEGVIVNQFIKNAKLPKQMIEEIRSEGLPVLSPFLSSSVIMRESRSAMEPLNQFKPNHQLAKDFRELAKGLKG